MADPHYRLARQPGRSLASRIFLFASVSILASTAVVSAVAIHSIHAQLSHSIERTYPAALVRAAEPVRGLLAAGQAELEALAENPDWVRRRGHALERPLLRAIGGSNHFAGLAVLAPNGSLRHAVGSAQGVDPEVLVDLVAPETEHPASLLTPGRRAAGPMIAVPLGSAKGPLGTLIGAFRPSAFRALLVAAQPDESSALYLIDGHGRVIVGFESSAENELERLPTAALPDGDLSNVRRYPNARGRHVIGSATPLGFFGWHRLVEKIKKLDEG